MLGSRSRKRLAGPFAPRCGTPHLGSRATPAFHRVPSDVRVRADLIATGLATDPAAVLMIEIDSISQNSVPRGQVLTLNLENGGGRPDPRSPDPRSPRTH